MSLGLIPGPKGPLPPLPPRASSASEELPHDVATVVGAVIAADTPSAPDARLPALYLTAKQALAECDRLDECKEWADKSAALASYAKQAKDKAMFNTARRILNRAIRREGELLKEIPSQAGKRTDLQPDSGTPTRLEVAEKAGLSRDQAVKAMQVANVPKDQFDKQVESPKPPTVTALAAQGRKPQSSKGLEPFNGRYPSGLDSNPDPIYPAPKGDLGLLVTPTPQTTQRAKNFHQHMRMLHKRVKAGDIPDLRTWKRELETRQVEDLRAALPAIIDYLVALKHEMFKPENRILSSVEAARARGEGDDTVLDDTPNA